MPDFALAIDGTNADMTFDDAADISNNVWLSLMVHAGSFFALPGFGSRFHELQPGKNTEENRMLVEQYAQEALQWLIDLGRATSVETSSERVQRGINLFVTVTQTNGPKISYGTFIALE